MTKQALCQCGCGQAVRIAPVNDKSKGWIKGEPLKFLRGHGTLMAAQAKTERSLGNKSISSHGYVAVCVGAGKRQYEHILVAEKSLGRRLRSFGRGNPKSEIVHHINGNKTDNRPDNLLVCTHEYHVALHHKLENSPDWPEFSKVERPGFGGKS